MMKYISLTDVVLPATALTVDKWSVHLMTLSQRVQFKVDTGAKCNTLTLDSYQQLVHTGELKRSNKLLRSYSNHKLKPVAAIDLSVHYKQCATDAEFEIVDIALESVLSGATAEILGLIARLNSVQNAAEAEADSPVEGILEQDIVPQGLCDFPELIRTTGTLPGWYTINIAQC